MLEILVYVGGGVAHMAAQTSRDRSAFANVIYYTLGGYRLRTRPAALARPVFDHAQGRFSPSPPPTYRIILEFLALHSSGCTSFSMGTAFALGFVASTMSSGSLMDKSRSVRPQAIAGESRCALCSRIQLYQKKYQRRNETPNVRTARRTNAQFPPPSRLVRCGSSRACPDVKKV